jgi:hypothetical protein
MPASGSDGGGNTHALPEILSQSDVWRSCLHDVSSSAAFQTILSTRQLPQRVALRRLRHEFLPGGRRGRILDSSRRSVRAGPSRHRTASVPSNSSSIHLASDLGVTLGSCSAIYNPALPGNRFDFNSAVGEDARRQTLPHPARGSGADGSAVRRFPHLSWRDGRDALRRLEFRRCPLEDPFPSLLVPTGSL